MRRPHLFAFLVVGVLAAPSAAVAAPCSSRVADAVAVDAGARAACVAGMGERAVFAFAPQTIGPVVADLEGTAFDAVLDVHRAAHDGSLGERILSWDQGDPRAAEHVAFDPQGEPVVLVVRGYRGAAEGLVSLGVRSGAPANALPGRPQPIALGDDGLGAAGMHWSLLVPAGLGAAALPARWFAFRARRDGRMTATTCTAYAGDSVVSAYRAQPDGSLTLLATNDDTPLGCERPGASFTGFPVVGGAEYRLAVRPAHGVAYGPETVVLGWDDTAPPTTLELGPAGVVADRTAAFAWSSPAADAVGFECSLDAGDYAPCARAYDDLGDGEHAFRVRAIDAAGNVGPAAERTWRIVAAGVSAVTSSRRRVGVETRKVAGPRAAAARGLAHAYAGKPRARFSAGGRGTTVERLALRSALPGTSVEVRCARRGNGCPFAARRVGASADLARLFRGRRLTEGAVLELRVTRPGALGRVFRWEMRRGRAPRASVACLLPGTTRTAPC